MNKVQQILKSFCTTFNLSRSEFSYSYLPAPHNPNSLPDGAVGIYIFEVDSIFLKVGKAGIKSKARFNSNHYTPKGGKSTLFNKILQNKDFLISKLYNTGLKNSVRLLNVDNTTQWIKNNTHRHEIIFLTDNSFILSLLEAYLQYYLEPIFEGKSTE